MLTRGSITYGEILYNDHIIFGLDLINAVELEENHRMPSIVVDPKLEKIFEGKNISFKNEIDLYDVWPNDSLSYQDCIDGINRYLVQVNKSYIDNSVLEKINWVIDRFNAYFAKEQKTVYKLVFDFNYHLEKESI